MRDNTFLRTQWADYRELEETERRFLLKPQLLPRCMEKEKDLKEADSPETLVIWQNDLLLD